MRQARAWNPALEPSAGAAARRAARIYNKHLDALCEHEPLTQMVLRAGDITWFDPNWYQTARAPRPSSHPSAAAAPASPLSAVWPCATWDCLAPASPAVARRRAGCLHQRHVVGWSALQRARQRGGRVRRTAHHVQGSSAPRLTRVCACAAQHQLENHTDDFCCTIQGAPQPPTR